MHVNALSEEGSRQRGSSFMVAMLGAGVHIYLLIVTWTLINGHTDETLVHILVGSMYRYIYLYKSLGDHRPMAGACGQRGSFIPASLGCRRLYLSIYLWVGHNRKMVGWRNWRWNCTNLVSFHVFFAHFSPAWLPTKLRMLMIQQLIVKLL